MIQKILSVFLLLAFATAYAQENIASQYSLHGIGIKRFRGTVANTSVGGLSLFSDAISPNVLNPATYADLERTSFSVGGTYTNLKLEGNTGSQNLSNTTFDYLTVSIPAKILGFGFGIVPHSSVGHEVTTIFDGEENRSVGKGDVNRAYFGVGAKIYKGFKIGAELRYNFGRLENTILTIPNNGGDSRQIVEQTDVSGFSYTFSGIYDLNVKEKYILRGSAQYEGSDKQKFSNVQEIAGVLLNGQSAPSILQNDRGFVDTEDFDFKLPTRTTLGLALIHKNKWAIGGEAFLSRNGNFKDRFRNRSLGSDATIIFKDGIGAKLGGQITPNSNSLTSYFSRVNYRAGLRYENTGLQINNTEINEFGISFGLGLPLPRGYSNLDLGFEFGARGKNNKEAIREQFFNFSIGLNLSDKWFRKRKYD